jgi:hypothetical protein
MILSVIAILTLGLIGYGYAAWSSTVTPNAMISTGRLVLGMAVAGTTDEGNTPDLTWGDPTADEPGTTPGLNVGSLTDANVGTPLAPFTTSGDASYYAGVTETYDNVYPDYQAGYNVDIANGGTIPIALDTPVIAWTTSDPSVEADYTVYSWTLTDATHPTTAPLASGSDNALAAINGVILPAGDVATLTVNAYYDTTTGLAQGATGSQTFTITGVQFNLSTGSAPGTPGNEAVALNSAAGYTILAATGITDAGGSSTDGDYGSIGATVASLSGGADENTDGSAGLVANNQAQTDLASAYDDAAGRTATSSGLSSLGGGQVLQPGIYNAPTSLGISGTVTLSGDSSSVFIFQVGSTLTTAADSQVKLSGGVVASNVFWQVGTSVAGLGANSTFYGTILANTSITTSQDTVVYGRLLAEIGAITLGTGTSVTLP